MDPNYSKLLNRFCMFLIMCLQSQALPQHVDLLRDSAGPDPRMKTSVRAIAVWPKLRICQLHNRALASACFSSLYL